jgi:hypothetical protein
VTCWAWDIVELSVNKASLEAGFRKPHRRARAPRTVYHATSQDVHETLIPRRVADRLLGMVCVLLQRQVLFNPNHGAPVQP